MIQFIIVTGLIFSVVSATLVLIFWTIDKEFIVSGYNIQLEPIFVLLCYLIWGCFYLRDENSPFNDAKNYQNFLEIQKIEFKKFHGIKLLWLFFICLFSKPKDDIRFTLLKIIGERASPCDTEARSESFALLSQGLFLKNKPYSRIQVFQEAAKNIGALNHILTYLDLTGKRGVITNQKTKDISLKALVKLTDSHIENRLKENAIGVKKDLSEIKNILSSGSWPESLDQILIRSYKPNKTEAFSYNFQGVLEEKPWLKSALQRIFKALPTSMIERYLASKKSNAYLITFHTPKTGSIADPLDELSQSGIMGNGVELYNYIFFVNNSRIGLLPQDMEFEEFSNNLTGNLANIINKDTNRKLKGGEIIVHRLGLSGEDYHLIEIPKVTEQIAIKQLQELLSNSLRPYQLLAILEYGQTFDHFLIELLKSPLFFLSNIKRPDEDFLQKISNEKKDELREAVFKGLKVNEFNNFTKYLRENGILEDDIDTIVTEFVTVLKQNELTLDIRDLWRIVQTYLETVQAITALQNPT